MQTKDSQLSAPRPRQERASSPQREVKEVPFERQFRTLETVSAFPRGLSLTELVAILGLPKTTVHRILQSLTRTGVLAAKNPRFGPYVLGPRFIGLLQSSMPDDWTERLAKPILRELAEKTGDTCFVARLTGTAIRSVAMATPENDVHVYVVPGRELSPLYAASAKAILAFQADEILDGVISAIREGASVSEAAVAEFLNELSVVRKESVAFNRGEDIRGYAAVAAPIHLRKMGVQFSVAVTGTFDRLMEPSNRKLLVTLTKAFARRLGDAIEVRISQEG